MEIGIIEGDSALNEPHEHDSAALRRQIECACHRRGIAGCVNDDRWQLAVSNALNLFQSGHAANDRMFYAELAPTEVEPCSAHVHHSERGGMQLHELDDAESDGTGADDEHEIITL